MTISASGWEAAIGMFLEHARTQRAPETTLTTRRQQLRLFGRTIGLDPWEVTAGDVSAWFAGREMADNTYRSRRTTLRAFYRWAVEAGHVASSPVAHLPPGAVPRPNPRPVPDRVYLEAWRAATDRERLIVALAADHGMRRAEVAQVHSDDLEEDLTGWSLRVHGKGGRDRIIPLTDKMAAALRALPPGWAFPGRDHGHLSPRWVGKLVARLLPGDWTMHKLRHRAATLWYEEEHDLFVVQELLGHASPATTRVYVEIERKRKRDTLLGAAARTSDRAA